jgi:hypothetical protein
MFDLDATRKWITAVLKTPDAAARDYAATGAPFMQSLMQLTVPGYVVAFVVGSVLGGLLGSGFAMGFGGATLFLMVFVMSIAWTFVIAFVFDFFAGTFGGVKNFDSAYGMVALAVIPACLGTALSGIAWIGPLVSLLASIWSIVLTWQFVPVFLKVPEENRGKHFGVSIVVLLVIGGILFAVYTMLFVTAALTTGITGAVDDETGSVIEDALDGAGQSGVFSGAERIGKLVEQAQQDTWDPPADGELTEEQVETYIRNMEKTKALEDRLGSKIKSLEKKEGEEPDLGDVFGSIGDIARIGTAETEVVKTAGGNWAEHLWVKSAIETARVQQDLDDAVKHNYALYLEYQEEIDALD